MGKRFFITETEKQRIKLLYEQTDKTQETIFLGYFNPFQNDKFRDAIREFSPNLKDGDRFIEWNSNRIEKLNEEIIKQLVGKTIRTNEKIRTIRTIKLNFSKIPSLKENQLPVDYMGVWFSDSSFVDNEIVYIGNYNVDEWKKNLSNYVSKKIPMTKDLDNDFFKIYEVKKIKTDFIP